MLVFSPWLGICCLSGENGSPSFPCVSFWRQPRTCAEQQLWVNRACSKTAGGHLRAEGIEFSRGRIFKLVSTEQIFPCSLFACGFLFISWFCFFFSDSKFPLTFVTAVLYVFSIWELLTTEGSETISCQRELPLQKAVWTWQGGWSSLGLVTYLLLVQVWLRLRENNSHSALITST